MRLSSWIYRIVRWGLGGVFIYSGGIFAWKGANYPLEKVE
jgi:rhodanese-related sulfurtransferase